MGGYVYFIRARRENLMKIGYSRSHPDSRFRQLRTANATPLEAVGYMEGTLESEVQVHEIFRRSWSHGEWFRITPSLESYIRKNTTPWAFASKWMKTLSRVTPIPTPDPPAVVARRAPKSVRSLSYPELRHWAESTTWTIAGTPLTVWDWSGRSGIAIDKLYQVQRGVVFEDLRTTKDVEVIERLEQAVASRP